MGEWNGAAPLQLRRFTARPAAANLVPGCLALAGVGAGAWVSFRFGQSFAFTGFLFLVLVVSGNVWRIPAGDGGFRGRRRLPELFFCSAAIQFCKQSGKLGGARRF